jgi:deoxyadenosine/deoxycytidine kinase
MSSFASTSTLTAPARLPLIVSIEGNIGAGKSTFLEKLRENLGEGDSNLEVVFMQEPVDVWQTITDKSGEDILTKYYADPAKYAFSFQIMAYSTRLAMFKKAVREHPNCDVILCERSLEADRNIFAKMLRDEGNIEDIMYQIYDRLYADTAQDYLADGIVYMATPPMVCYDRIQQRNRKGESEIAMPYLMNCHAYHTAWLSNQTDLEEKTEVLPLNPDDAQHPEEEWVQRVSDFLVHLVQKQSLARVRQYYGSPARPFAC